MYEHVVGEFFLTFSSCQKSDQPEVDFFSSSTTKPLQSRLTSCNWQTQSRARKVKSKASLVTFGCWQGFCSNMKTLMQLVGVRA